MKIICVYLGLLILWSCEISPKKINYGQEHCNYCEMTIVDRQHAAQIVTDKGKVFNFDAIECMIHYYSTSNPTTAFISVNDYTTPDKFIDAQLATYIISPEIPSPMGANLSAVVSEEKAQSILKNKEGYYLNWTQLLNLQK